MNKNRFPFTPSQWQELEHQALVYKYMASGISIPPDLLFTIRRSFFDSPLISSTLLPNQTQQQHFGWNYLQMGIGRKIDPEPGRCRRTDGKKWRCSKEAYQDSKYCERHMHRGKNRSRKPVEVFKTTTTNANANANANANNPSTLTSNNSSLSFDTQQHHHHSHLQHSFLYHHPSSKSSSSTAIVLSSYEDNSAPLFLDTNSCSHNNTDYRNRYVYGEKEDVDEYAFFKEPSGSSTMKSFSTSSMDRDSWQLTPLTMSSSSSSSSSRLRSFSSLSNDYSCLQLQSLSEQSKQQEQEKEPQKTVHRFFDEWPHKGREQWLHDLDDKSSTTQLSISIPSSAHDFPTFTSSTHHDD
ncbi:growth-regulating factor 3 isoform X1 [Cicer arietinum]|uniref:Growth-regulating factor n=1 Tax=Cicer arietinum TaxID=3827 RepID=A0A1S2Z1T8_CICAR|nr:growth-regulating factor 1 [Cicer arietinum]